MVSQAHNISKKKEEENDIKQNSKVYQKNDVGVYPIQLA